MKVKILTKMHLDASHSGQPTRLLSLRVLENPSELQKEDCPGQSMKGCSCTYLEGIEVMFEAKVWVKG